MARAASQRVIGRWQVALAIVFLLALALLGAFALRPGATGTSAFKSTPIPKSFSPSAVLSISASNASAPLTAARSTVPGLVQEYERSTRLRPLYDRLRSGAAPTPEGKLALYLILRECANVQGGGVDRRQYPDAKTLSASISDANPDKQMRLRIAEELKARCEGFDGVVTSRAELHALLEESAAAGVQAARVRLLGDELIGTMKPGEGLSISDFQIEALRQAVASGDPDAIQGAGTLLSNTFADLVIESSQTHEAVQQGAAYYAWQLLACEYGADCGSSNTWLRMVCATEGDCAAMNLQDAIMFYQVSPSEAQLIDQYRSVFRAAANGDWSGLEFARRPGGTGRQYYFTIP